ncbi:hypothetical protein NGUA15_00649 [Salmonella enterica]|nr:hypothetical protein NGUA15_00649 [Salmonella enterica]CPR74928.1 Uncharacterised protein [Salmonella enterica subsp. enterica serovar Bovismorbificans]
MSGDIRQSDFMALRNMFSQFQAIRKTCSGFKTVVINNNCDIIGFMYFYIKRRWRFLANFDIGHCSTFSSLDDRNRIIYFGYG